MNSKCKSTALHTAYVTYYVCNIKNYDNPAAVIAITETMLRRSEIVIAMGIQTAGSSVGSDISRRYLHAILVEFLKPLNLPDDE